MAEKASEEDNKFSPSPIKLVRFADGKTIPMNRAVRRRNKIYGNKGGK